MKPRTSRMLLGAALLLTLGAAWMAPEDGSSGLATSEAAPARPARERSAAAAPAVEVLAIRPRRGDDTEDAQLFGSTRWSAAQAPAAAPEAAPAPQEASAAPQAPPLPFRVLGSYEQAGQTVVFLQQNDRNHVVRAGDTIEDTYKVESLDGAVLTLRYLPLGQTQTLDLGRTLKEK